MANNRYYIQCPVCKKEIFFGKSLGGGIYNMAGIKKGLFTPKQILKGGILEENQDKHQAIFLEEIYNWMWEHMMECHKDEFKGGELFKIVSEYKK